MNNFKLIALPTEMKWINPLEDTTTKKTTLQRKLHAQTALLGNSPNICRRNDTDFM